jgi:hypothetical protein
MLLTARFIVMLRDPVARAYSQYLHSRNLGVENLSFDDALWPLSPLGWRKPKR